MTDQQGKEQHPITQAFENVDAARIKTSQAILALVAELAAESDSPSVQRLYQRAHALANSHANSPLFKQ